MYSSMRFSHAMNSGDCVPSGLTIRTGGVGGGGGGSEKAIQGRLSLTSNLPPLSVRYTGDEDVSRNRIP